MRSFRKGLLICTAVIGCGLALRAGAVLPEWVQTVVGGSAIEAALFRMNKVKTPTHIVQGNSDVRVSYLEGVTLERALEQLNVPHSFLVFPGEGHGLSKNPWHGYIKVREELAWLDKYCPK